MSMLKVSCTGISPSGILGRKAKIKNSGKEGDEKVDRLVESCQLIQPRGNATIYGFS